MRSGAVISSRECMYANSLEIRGDNVMNLPEDTTAVHSADNSSSAISRRSFFTRAAIAGATGSVALSGLVSLASAFDLHPNASAEDDDKSARLKRGDRDILVAA